MAHCANPTAGKDIQYIPVRVRVRVRVRVKVRVMIRVRVGERASEFASASKCKGEGEPRLRRTSHHAVEKVVRVRVRG